MPQSMVHRWLGLTWESQNPSFHQPRGPEQHGAPWVESAQNTNQRKYRPNKAGWWYTYPSEKYEFVSWGYDIPNWMESHTIPWFQTTNQNTTNQNMLVRLGWWHSQLLGKIKNSMVPNHQPDTNGYLLAITICLFNIAMENHHSPVGVLNFSPITPYK